jgi:hypothetical protein
MTIKRQSRHNIGFPFWKTVMAVIFFFHRMRLSPLSTAATVWTTVPAPDDRRWWLLSNRWNANWQGKPKSSEKTCPSATFSTTNPTWLEPGSKPGRCGGKQATNRLRNARRRLSLRLRYSIIEVPPAVTSSWKWRRVVRYAFKDLSEESGWTSTRLCGVTSQKMVLFKVKMLSWLSLWKTEENYRKSQSRQSVTWSACQTFTLRTQTKAVSGPSSVSLSAHIITRYRVTCHHGRDTWVCVLLQ